MNNRQTSRRRGRGNNRTQSNNRNGYDNQNRIDNRARGNAAQMLEKYKKLAQDAQLNGDRVQAEYFHQFADHYFRVLADYRSRQEESRPQRNEWRGDDREGGERDWRDDDRGNQANENGDEDTFNTEIEPDVRTDDEGEPVRAERNDRRPQRNTRNDRGERNDRGDRNNRNNDRGERNDRNPRGNSERRERYADEGDRGNGGEGIDLAVLPPSIGVFDEGSNEPEAVEAKPARKPRTRRPKTANDEEVVTAAE